MVEVDGAPCLVRIASSPSKMPILGPLCIHLLGVVSELDGLP